MKTLTILSTVLILAACSSGGMYSSSEDGPDVTLDVQQISSASDTFYFRGPISVGYRLTINNPTDDPITLRSLNLQTVGPGAYTLRTGTSPIRATVPPRSSISIPLSAWGHAAGGFMRSTEPVTLRGVAQFESPRGSFMRQVTELLSQY